MPPIENRYLHYYLKALADDTRLRMVGLLAEREYTVRELAAALAIKEPSVSHHLSKLRSIHMVNLRTEGTQRFYRINAETLQAFKDGMQHIEKLSPELPEDDNAWINDLPEDFTEADRKVLHDYTYAGRLRQIPSKAKKLLVILRWLAAQFEADVIYTEQQVNAIITRYHDDYATLRRSLISYGYLRRERGGSKYWLASEDDAPVAPPNWEA